MRAAPMFAVTYLAVALPTVTLVHTELDWYLKAILYMIVGTIYGALWGAYLSVQYNRAYDDGYKARVGREMEALGRHYDTRVGLDRIR